LLARIVDDEETQAPPSSAAHPASPAITDSKVANFRGRAKEILCAGGARNLSVEADGREMIFDINDPHLVVRHPTADYSKWRCGPLNSSFLTIVYTPSSSANSLNPKAIELVF
jgi:hypothetical protein